MMHRPRVHPWLTVAGVPDGVVLMGRGTPIPLPHPEEVRIAAARADGSRAWAELAAHPRVALGLAVLERHCALVDAAAVPVGAPQDAAQRAWLGRLAAGADAHETARTVHRRGQCGIAVHSAGPDGADGADLPLFRAALRAAGLRQATAQPGVLLVVGRPVWPQIHAWMLNGTTHLVISPRAASVRVGPLVVPGSGPCLRCLHLARRDRHRHWSSVVEQLAGRPVPTPDTVLLVQAAALAARMLVDLCQDATGFDGTWWELRSDQPAPVRHATAQHPLCGCWWPAAPT